LSNANARTFNSATSTRAARAIGAAPRGLARAAHRLLRLALPQACALCAARAGDALVCGACTAALPRLPPACPVCALPTPGGEVCGACLRHPPPFAATVAPLLYAFPVDRLLQQLKYAGRLAYAEWAAAILAGRAAVALAARDPVERPQRIVALPLAASRQRERGFNQAQEIAARVARRVGLPLARVLERRVQTVPQAALPWSERVGNVRGAFAVRRADTLRDARIALVDDVMTTGATLAEAARVLRHAGAAHVECWVVARTLPPGEQR
jgi:ComF family protein